MHLADHLAAGEERRHRIQQLATTPEGPRTGGSEHLVCGAYQEVRAQRLDVELHVRRALRCVNDHGGAVLLGDACDLGRRIHGAEYVGDVHERHQLHFAVVQEARKCIQIQLAGAAHGNKPQLELLLGSQHLPRYQVGVVLHGREQDGVARLERPRSPGTRHQVQRLGRVAREDDLARAGVDERRESPARVLVEGRGLLGDAVHAAMDVRVARAVVTVHRVQHALRLLRCGGAVEVHERLGARRVEDGKLRLHDTRVEPAGLAPGRARGGRRRGAGGTCGTGGPGRARGVKQAGRHQPILRWISTRRRSRTVSSGMRPITGSKNASTMSRCASSRGRPRAMR